MRVEIMDESGEAQKATWAINIIIIELGQLYQRRFLNPQILVER